VSIAAADLQLRPSGSADRRADVAVTEAPDSSTTPSRLEVWRSAADGSLSTYGGPYQFAAGTSPAQIISGDFNADGRPDLAVAESGASAVGVLRNLGNGAFDVPGGSYLAASHPDGLATGRLCLMGAEDLVATNFYTNDAMVLCNDGSGSFQAGGGHFFSTGGVHPAAVAIADLNSDGLPDVIVANEGAPGSMTVLRSLPAASPPDFAAAQAISAYSGTYPGGLAVGDLNGDGRPDTVVANPGDDTISVLINTTPRGSSSFSFTENTYSVGARPAGGGDVGRFQR
jgi:hypothetical protein